MACLVACSFPRAELTALSYRVDGTTPELKERLNACKTNRDRASVVAETIQIGNTLNVPDDSDAAAVERMRNLLTDPNRVLHDIERHLVAVFRRLYRQRNLVLHGGKTDAVALRSSIRTAAPIVGAGMDRVAHAWFVENTPPLELAARARINFELVGSIKGPAVVDLLG